MSKHLSSSTENGKKDEIKLLMPSLIMEVFQSEVILFNLWKNGSYKSFPKDLVKLEIEAARTGTTDDSLKDGTVLKDHMAGLFERKAKLLELLREKLKNPNSQKN